MKINPISLYTRSNIIKNNELKHNRQSTNTNIYGHLPSANIFFIPHYFINFGMRNPANEDINFEYFKIKQPKHLKEPVKPDVFQTDAARCLQEGNSVLVCAPTGTGKTAIAQYIMSKNLEEGKKTFYTTPLKALSNQKLSEFREIYGKENVGILTGDRKENANAPIVIMTTEVYRNMGFGDYFSKQNKRNVDTVIFDEFHYLGDPSRGISWEEAIMYSPANVQILALSATIGNHRNLTDWLSSISRKDCVDVYVPSSERSIPLRYEYYDATRAPKEKNIENKYYRAHVSPEKAKEEKTKRILANYMELIKDMQHKKKLPAIMFVYSKSMNRTLVNESAANGPILTTAEERLEIAKRLEAAKLDKTPENYVGNNLNEAALLKGYAMHNAGLMPGEKALVESLFADNLLKVVYATETLSAGINMPARTVVISSPIKVASDCNGALARRELTANEYHQMAGRAGRRGLDVSSGGYVINFCTSSDDVKSFRALVTSSPDPIISQFKPTYTLISSCLEYNDNLNDLIPFAEKSFRYQSDVTDTQEKYQAHAEESFNNDVKKVVTNKTNLLLKEGFIVEHGDNKLYLTDKGVALKYIIGYPQIPIINMINSGILNHASPDEIVYLAAGIIDSLDSRPISINGYEDDDEKKETFLSDILDETISLYNSKKEDFHAKLPRSFELMNIDKLNVIARHYARQKNKYQNELVKYHILDEPMNNIAIRYAPKVALFAILNKANPNNPLENWEKIDKYVIRNRTKCGKQTEYSGELFFKTSQTIDLLNQILELCTANEFAYNEDYKALAEKIKQAIALIQKPPIPIYQNDSN